MDADMQQGSHDSTSINCYFHNISPVKTASTSNKKYFNCVVQCSDKSVRAVCYSPEKRAELHALAATRSPVKLDNYTSDPIIEMMIL